MHNSPNPGIRGRAKTIPYGATPSATGNPATAAPISATSAFTSRIPRPRPPMPLSSGTAASDMHHNSYHHHHHHHHDDSTPLKKGRGGAGGVGGAGGTGGGLPRIVPTSVVVATVALSFLVFGIMLTRSVSTVVLPASRDVGERVSIPRPPAVGTGAVAAGGGNAAGDAPVVQLAAPMGAGAAARPETAATDSVADTAGARRRTAQAAGAGGGTGGGTPSETRMEESGNSPVASAPEPATQAAAAAAPAPVAVAPAVPQPSKEGMVSWNRSWPLTAADDVTGLIPLAATLKFTNVTMLDYFHLHKTGGVTTKSQLRELINRPENKVQMTKRGEPMGVIETCYRAVSPASKLTVREVNWRCDFRQIKEMPQEELRGIDIIMGHQYWNNGCDFYFGSMRDVKFFSIFRHPLHRKLSFFYHFFVRNEGREEKAVPRDEVLKFVLADDLSTDPRSRDSGPNYFASRFMSTGMSGFMQNQYPISKDEEDGIIKDILGRLETRYAFVGLQLHSEAGQCMLEKAVQVLAHAHGIDTMVGTTKLGEYSKRLNSGEYPWTAKKLWASMTGEEKRRFNEAEKVDLAIYRKAVERFTRDVKLFKCEHKVDKDAWDEDVFE